MLYIFTTSMSMLNHSCARAIILCIELRNIERCCIEEALESLHIACCSIMNLELAGLFSRNQVVCFYAVDLKTCLFACFFRKNICEIPKKLYLCTALEQ